MGIRDILDPGGGASSAMIEVAPGVRLRVIRRDGIPDRIPFLLVHGLASNARFWDGVGDLLADAGHPSVAVDLRGHGHSTKTDDGYDAATLVSDLSTVIEATFGRPVVVAGQSWGADVALHLAVGNHRRVRGLVLVDGGFMVLRRVFPDWDTAWKALKPPSFANLTLPELRRGVAARFRGWPSEAVEAVLANFEETPNGTVRARLTQSRHRTILRHLWEDDAVALAESVEVPVIVLVATEGRPGREAAVAAFAESLPDGEVRWVEGHHDLHAQRPDLVARTLLELAGRVS